MFHFIWQNLKRQQKNSPTILMKEKTLRKRKMSIVASQKWERCPKNVSLSFILFLNNCILISPHVVRWRILFSFLFYALIVIIVFGVVVVVFCLIFEMSHHFDGTSLSSVLYAISHVKRVKNWHIHITSL